MAGAREPLTYRDAGVDIDAKETILAGVGGLVRSTFRDGVLNTGGEFGGLFRLAGYRDPVLVTSIDGVGTKTRIAALFDRWDVIGADIVAHGANDVLCHGATPLFMVDYIAAEALAPEVVAPIIEGMTAACRRHGVALLGGETAEMPGIYKSLQVDVAGCTVGAVERDRLITGRAVRPGDVIVGLASDGLHTNGYSLARTVLLPGGGLGDAARRALERTPRGFTEPLADALLRPHRCYVRTVLDLRERVDVRAIAHVTGGGIPGNLVRVLPEGCRAAVDRGRWPVPPLFALIQRRGRVADGEMWRAFNMGLGLLLVVPRAQAADAVARLERAGERTWVVGEIVGGSRGVELV
ncbi:MAG TPA: phosphoribosylformylglycinamidine cyclo-ligase [bacterium]|nr:phosphoribosylformylglycinamidine cyclo-ligase [bacterium]